MYKRQASALINAKGGEIYELAGSEHLTLSDIAATLAKVSGRHVHYQDLPEADFAAALTSNGVPEAFAKVLADSDAGIARGELDSDSTDLETLAGHPSTPLADVISGALSATGA